MKQKQLILSADDLSIGYRINSRRLKYVHSHLDFQLYRGELTCLLGANGTGKSTLLRTLSASQPSLSGMLFLGGKLLSTYSERELSRLIGVVLTDKTQAGGLSVYDLVALGRQPHTGFFGRLQSSDHAAVEKALADVGITHKAQHYVAELSDGERQKALIAKALVQECPLILLDEPTAFLDVVSRIEVMNLLHTLAHTQQKAILLSTHDVEQALVLADKLWLFSGENSIQCGVTEDLILSGAMNHLFGGESVLFDTQHGTYYPLVGGRESIRLIASDDLLQHWAINALNRQGYNCLLGEDMSRSVHSLRGECPVLTVRSSDELILSNGDQVQKFSSFKELLSFLPEATL
ncbi:MAG: ABC transporter ATP-binding protein [Bacteroidaceae bacterium]|nr:ABC transporter ATP-binding protein [Bacteroidaceae bacterium]MBP9637615.1 ABC transporter ATP-binding protein [Bacteroidaceae bacterium]